MRTIDDSATQSVLHQLHSRLTLIELATHWLHPKESSCLELSSSGVAAGIFSGLSIATHIGMQMMLPDGHMILAAAESKHPQGGLKFTEFFYNSERILNRWLLLESRA